MKGDKSGHPLKYISLVTLMLHSAILGLSMRYSRTREGDMFLASTAILMAELVKLATCLSIVYVQMGNFKEFLHMLDKTIIKDPVDTLKVCVPSFAYLVQNNLLYVSASYLDVATYQVTYQLKILAIAIFAVIILQKELLRTQWFSLITLVIGVVLVQLSQSSEALTTKPVHEQNRLIGFIAALSASILSGFAGIYFEKMLKGSDVTVWMRNVQLSLCSVPFGLISCFFYDGSIVRKQGFFFGYNLFIVYLIILQACGGLLVALVVKYADNILKCFATSLAITISCVVSIWLFNFILTLQFLIGVTFVIFSIFLYGHIPSKQLYSSAHKKFDI